MSAFLAVEGSNAGVPMLGSEERVARFETNLLTASR